MAKKPSDSFKEKRPKSEFSELNDILKTYLGMEISRKKDPTGGYYQGFYAKSRIDGRWRKSLMTFSGIDRFKEHIRSYGGVIFVEDYLIDFAGNVVAKGTKGANTWGVDALDAKVFVAKVPRFETLGELRMKCELGVRGEVERLENIAELLKRM